MNHSYIFHIIKFNCYFLSFRQSSDVIWHSLHFLKCCLKQSSKEDCTMLVEECFSRAREGDSCCLVSDSIGTTHLWWAILGVRLTWCDLMWCWHATNASSHVNCQSIRHVSLQYHHSPSLLFSLFVAVELERPGRKARPSRLNGLLVVKTGWDRLTLLVNYGLSRASFCWQQVSGPRLFLFQLP